MLDLQVKGDGISIIEQLLTGCSTDLIGALIKQSFKNKKYLRRGL